MPPPIARLTFAACCLLAALPAVAATVTRVDVSGLPDPLMADNVRLKLSLSDAVGKDVSARRLAYLLRQAEVETREALEPFGYYAPVIVIQRSDRSAAEGIEAPASPADAARNAGGDEDRTADAATRAARTLSVSIRVDPGQPVRIRGFDVGVDGAAGNDAAVQKALADFVPRKGDVLEHTLYEASKARVSRRLAAQGYFDADFAAHRVEVTRADQAADIALRWTSGARYALGDVDFEQTPRAIISDSLLRKLVDWDSGDPFDEAKLERLRQSLVSLDYFGVVEVLPQPEQAIDEQVPVQVNLTPAPRSIYLAGASYGTESGAGVRLGAEQRYLNVHGHKALAQLDYAQKRKTLTLQYRVPAFAWLDGWYSASLQAADEQTDALDTRRVEFVASRSGQFNNHLNLVASAHVLRERWTFLSVNRPVPVFQYASFVFPSLRAEYIDVDNRLAPRRGAGGTLTVRGGQGGANRDATFAQLHASAQWFRGLDADSRLIVRGEAGHTFTNELIQL
ncbi:MAG: POTRA domain-containing protein, partial [Pseudomonadota bacterium]